MSVVTVGMHRSGTSAVAAVLRAAGLEIPNDRHLKPLARDELKGFHEPLQLVEMNDELLARLGGDWSAPPDLGAGWERAPEIDDLRDRAATTFREVTAPERWIWKDPRNCLTLPFWFDVLDVRPVVLFVHRNPREVARSLSQRAQLPPAVGFALWERYVRDALGNMSGAPVVVADSRGLQEDPVGWAREVTTRLASLDVPVQTLDEDVVRRFFESPLARLSLYIDSPTEELPSAEQDELLAVVRSLEGHAESFPDLELPPPTPWVRPLLDERRRRLEERRTHAAEVQGFRERLRRLQHQNQRLRQGDRGTQEGRDHAPLWKRAGRSVYRRIRGIASRSEERRPS